MVDTNPTIMVIDDDDLVRDSLKTLLRSAGFKTEVFDNAKSFLKSGHHSGVDVLILDVQMPGMNGLELQQHLAEADIAIPIIFMTAHEDDSVRMKAMGLGAVAFLQKPFEGNSLIGVIQDVLG